MQKQNKEGSSLYGAFTYAMHQESKERLQLKQDTAYFLSLEDFEQQVFLEVPLHISKRHFKYQ